MAAMYNDVCCVSFQTGTELVAVVQAIEAVILCATGTALITEVTWPQHISEGIFLGIPVVLIAVGLLSLVLAVVLYQGSEERNIKKCNVWVRCKIVLFFVGFCGVAVCIFYGKLHFYLFMTACNLLLTLYCVWIVWSFIKEIRSECPIELNSSGCEL